MGPYIYDVYTEGWGGEVLKFVKCLRILLFLNNRSIVHFCGWWSKGAGVKNLVTFCGHHKWMTPMLKFQYYSIKRVLLKEEKVFHEYPFKRHTGIPGLWTQDLDAGLWTLAAGLWTLGSGCWTLVAGLWALSVTVVEQNQNPVSDFA